ncbi:hypothetical protein ACW9H6_17090 [Pseudomonas sp. SDO528_S397]
MRLNSTATPFAAAPHLSAENPDTRVSMNRVLEGGTLQKTEKRVTPREMDALLIGNKVIDDTWRILSKGAGNQRRAVIASEGDSFKRMMVLRGSLSTENDLGDVALAAARIQGGGCGDMAAIAALLSGVSGVNQPVNHLSSDEQDHQFVEIGDARMGRTVIVDPWVEFGRAMLREDYALLGRHPDVVDTYEPDTASPRVRTRLIYDDKVRQEHIDQDFAKAYPEMPKDPKKLAGAILKKYPEYMYAQRHGAKDLSVAYTGKDTHGRSHTVDLDLSQDQFVHRLKQLGLDAKKGEPVVAAQTSLLGSLKRALGSKSTKTSDVVTQWTPSAQAEGSRQDRNRNDRG